MRPQFLFIGLGNPGKQYVRTRHNAGFLAVEQAAKECGAGEFADKQKFLSFIAEGEIHGVPCFFVKPTTFMNRSGECIRKLLDFYKLNAATDMLVCCDDIDIPLGTHRLRMTGGPGTHNGLKSIVESVGENFPRLRIGIGPQPKETDLANWVLSAMQEAELKELQSAFDYGPVAAKEVMKQRKA